MMNTTPSQSSPDPAPTPDEAGPALDAASLTALRAPAVRHLLALRAERRLTRAWTAPQRSSGSPEQPRWS
ncbi:hypothetical protein [Streptomyces sp. NPDC001880]